MERDSEVLLERKVSLAHMKLLVLAEQARQKGARKFANAFVWHLIEL